MNAFAPDTGLLPGFSDPVAQAQKTFRAVLEAVSRPGTIVAAPHPTDAPAPLSPVVAALALTLADYETPVWLDAGLRVGPVMEYLRFHCGCPLVDDPAQAVFALVSDPVAMPPLSAFNLGTDDYPDRSTTVILQVPSLTEGTRWTLSGPGIRDRAHLSAAHLPQGFKDWVRDNHALFPRGVDLVFADDIHLAGLPRSTHLED